jgi:hypothetical protein
MVQFSYELRSGKTVAGCWVPARRQWEVDRAAGQNRVWRPRRVPTLEELIAACGTEFHDFELLEHTQPARLPGTGATPIDLIY